MNSTNVRYKIFPQMEDYDKMNNGQFSPYSMLAGPYNFRSKRINTDSYGFRWTKVKEISSVDNIDQFPVINLIVGGSTVFGVGSTNDSTTIASKLENLTQQKWINLGVRGCNSMQEYIHLIQHLHKAKKVNNLIFVSGINDLYLTLINSEFTNYDFGFGTKYSKISAYHPYHQSIAIFFSNLYGIDFNKLIKLRKRQIVFPFNKIQKNESVLNFTQKVERLFFQYERNLKLYNGLKSSFGIKKITYMLQPLIFWSKTKLTNNEYQVINYLNDIQKGSTWEEFKSIITEEALYEKILTFFDQQSRVSGINFFDSNRLFLEDQNDCFVDSVHLTDYGNKIISDKILNLI